MMSPTLGLQIARARRAAASTARWIVGVVGDPVVQVAVTGADAAARKAAGRLAAANQLGEARWRVVPWNVDRRADADDRAVLVVNDHTSPRDR
jgi:hypothetical protein